MFYKRSIKTQIIGLFLCSLLLLYIVIWMVLSIGLFQPLKKERSQYIIYYGSQIVSGVKGQKQNYDNILYYLRGDYSLKKRLSESYHSSLETWAAMTEIKNLLRNNAGIVSGIHSLAIYMRGSEIWPDGKYMHTENFDDSYKQNNMKWNYRNGEGSQFFCVSNEISGLYNGVEAYAELLIDGQSAFGNFLNIDEAFDGRAYLIDHDGFIIAGSKAFFKGRNLYELEKIPAIKPEEENVHISADEIISISPVNNDWSVVVIFPSTYTQKQMQGTYLLIGGVMAAVAIVMSTIFGMSMSRIINFINRLAYRMDHIWEEDTEKNDAGEKLDELNRLEVQYNRMVKRLNDTLNEMTKVRTQKQRFEIRSLEAQINPHFLYNTLGVMRWEAMDRNSEKLVGMIDNLTIFYRQTLNKGKSFLTVNQEVELIKAYIAIQQERYDHCVTVNIEVDCSVWDVVIPKMILQPLVENIWVHSGITGLGRQYIEITIHRLKDDMIQVIVADNGIGIPSERLEKIKTGNDEEGIGIGVNYIRSILNYYYGEDFIYDIRSKEGEGTKVSIIIPDEIPEKS